MADARRAGRDKRDHQFFARRADAAVTGGQQVHGLAQAAGFLAAAEDYAGGGLFSLHAGVENATAGYALGKTRGQQQALAGNG
ncbi:hypothetical protein D3C79_992740 [compost metagenome]